MTSRRRRLVSLAARAAATVFAGLYFFQSSTLAPNHTDEGLILQCIELMAYGRKPYFDFADAYGLLNWVFPVAFYKLFGYHVWGVRMWMLLLKVITVWTGYALVRGLTEEPEATTLPSARRRGRVYGAFAFVGMMVLLGAQWQSLETAYAFITVMPLTLAAWYYMLVAPAKKPHVNVIAAAVLTACAIWTKLNTGMYLLSGGLFTYFFWVPAPLTGRYAAGIALLERPNARRWFGHARVVGLCAYAALFCFSIRQHYNVWFFLYLIVPLMLGLTWAASVARPENDPETPLADYFTPFRLYFAVSVALSLAILFGYYGGHAFAYASELARLLSLIHYTAPFPKLGLPGGYIGLNEYYWLELPWLFTGAFVLWMLLGRRFGERAYGSDWPRRRAQVSALFMLMTLHTFVMYARSDETHIYQALVLVIPSLFVVVGQIDAFLGARSATSPFPLRLGITGFGFAYVLSLLVLPTADTFRIGRGDWTNPKLEHLTYRREHSPYTRDLSMDIWDHEWDHVEDDAAAYVKSISVPEEQMLLLTANRLVYYNSDTRPVAGRFDFFFYLASVGLLDRAGINQLVPAGIVQDILIHPPRIIVSSIGHVPLADVFPEFVMLRENWYQQTRHFRHILIYELRVNGAPVPQPLR
ncbi:MAG TPA: hypothetical protein VHU80_20820 [Polyangiaceae bacterium]|jgi:hypothetical protein|nr:hypothetical protein [Polyangiaceae bacterium]